MRWRGTVHALQSLGVSLTSHALQTVAPVKPPLEVQHNGCSRGMIWGRSGPSRVGCSLAAARCMLEVVAWRP